MKRNLRFALFLILAGGLAACTVQKDELDIPFEKYTLANGLEVILHQDHSDPIVALTILYHVGSNREVEGRTGFAHLFEHIMFQRSENVPEDQFFKIVQDAGGTLNGGTGNDATTYFEVVPKNALETVLWLESDRMGFLRNTITQKTFAIQQNVVQNEKRQGVDNAPYGFTGEVVAKNLYPKGHPYSWTVIGEMADLANATLEDVKDFHSRFYVPNNATLVLAGDFEADQARALIEKYFGEIPGGAEVKDPEPNPVSLDQTRKLYHEDNFARAPQFRMAWPTVEQFSPDSYALSYLGQLLARGKNAPMYKVLVRDKKLTSGVGAYNGSQEIAGSFGISVTANEGVSLKDVEEAIFEAFALFEQESFTEEDVERIKAGQETSFYNGISSILGKTNQLARYNEYAGAPDFYKKDIERTKAVTRDDILRVYEQYVKGKPYLATSFVPKGQLALVAEGSTDAGVVEEDILNATEVAIAEEEEEAYERTPSSFDRSVMPVPGPDPDINLPQIWQDRLANGMNVLGIEHRELPLINLTLVIRGGQFTEDPAKAGVASLTTQLMNEGTALKTPQELEEAIELLGSSIRVSSSSTDITISVNTLVRNYPATLAIMQEMLLEPRWDEAEFELAQMRVLNNLKRSKGSPNTLAAEQLQKLVYGDEHIFALNGIGTEESVTALTLDDLKSYYDTFFSPSVASIHVAGAMTKEEIMESLQGLSEKWSAKEVAFPEYTMPPAPEKSVVYLIDVPGAKQSVINIGAAGPYRTDPDFYACRVMNDKLGGSFNGWVNMVLREEKGYTYGARTSFSGSYASGVFSASSSVRSTATLESVQIFRDLMAKYREGISQEELDFTKNSMLKSYARQFETLRALVGMLEGISMYELPHDYVLEEQRIIRGMTLDQHRELAQRYIEPGRMYYVVAGDAATQAKELASLGFPMVIRK